MKKIVDVEWVGAGQIVQMMKEAVPFFPYIRRREALPDPLAFDEVPRQLLSPYLQA